MSESRRRFIKGSSLAAVGAGLAPAVQAAATTKKAVAPSNRLRFGVIAFKVGRKVHWDAAARSFKGDAEANPLLAPRYHNGWTLPRA
jgi:hypothetical protein